jgi:3-oxoacyl-(acyl-carrier-protein) synthase
MQAVRHGEALALRDLLPPGREKSLRVRPVPPPATRPAFGAHPRLRRASPISHYAVAAALEALGVDVPKADVRESRLGLVLCVMSGCVNYSRRFYDEVLRDPQTASPLLFPETVFNAPSSHLAALLGTTAINYTLVGDPATFLNGLAIAAEWLLAGRVDGCLVIGAEEHDWTTAAAFHLFSRRAILADGAGALYLKRSHTEGTRCELTAVTSAHTFHSRPTRSTAALEMRDELRAFGETALLVDGRQGVPRFDEAENAAWRDWPGRVLSPKRTLGEGLAAASAWQAVIAAELLAREEADRTIISLVGCNQHAIGAVFSHPSAP